MTALSTTWHHLRRSPFQSLTASLVMTTCFFIFTSFLILSFGLAQVLQYFENKPEITLFLKDGLDKNKVATVQQQLAAYPEVKEVKFVSKDQALDLYKEENKNNPLLLEMVTSSALPASFEVSANNPLVLGQIATDFSSRTDVIDEIVYQKDIIQTLLSWTSIVRRAGLAIIGVFTSISFLIIFIIVGMKITNRKEEIRISRLLGASRFYVQRPFLLEGCFYGLIGSLIGFGLSCGLAFYFKLPINGFFDPIPFLTTNYRFYAQILGIEVITGLLLGLTASWIGVKRYIKY